MHAPAARPLHRPGHRVGLRLLSEGLYFAVPFAEAAEPLQALHVGDQCSRPHAAIDGSSRGLERQRVTRGRRKSTTVWSWETRDLGIRLAHGALTLARHAGSQALVTDQHVADWRAQTSDRPTRGSSQTDEQNPVRLWRQNRRRARAADSRKPAPKKSALHRPARQTRHTKRRRALQAPQQLADPAARLRGAAGDAQAALQRSQCSTAGWQGV